MGNGQLILARYGKGLNGDGMVTDYKLTRFPVTHHTCTFEHYFGCHGVGTVIEVAKRAKQPMCSKGRSLCLWSDHSDTHEDEGYVYVNVEKETCASLDDQKTVVTPLSNINISEKYQFKYQ